MGQTLISEDGCFEWDEEKPLPTRKNMGLYLKKSYQCFSIPERLNSEMDRMPIMKSGTLQSVMYREERFSWL